MSSWFVSYVVAFKFENMKGHKGVRVVYLKTLKFIRHRKAGESVALDNRSHRNI